MPNVDLTRFKINNTRILKQDSLMAVLRLLQAIWCNKIFILTEVYTEKTFHYKQAQRKIRSKINNKFNKKNIFKQCP